MHTTITPATENNEDMKTVPVIVASLNGKLAVHRSVSELGYTLTHVPSGFAVRTRIVSKRDAEDLLLAIEHVCDWNFRAPHGRKWARTHKGVWPFVKDVPRHPDI